MELQTGNFTIQTDSNCLAMLDVRARGAPPESIRSRASTKTGTWRIIRTSWTRRPGLAVTNLNCKFVLIFLTYSHLLDDSGIYSLLYNIVTHHRLSTIIRNLSLLHRECLIWKTRESSAESLYHLRRTKPISNQRRARSKMTPRVATQPTFCAAPPSTSTSLRSKQATQSQQ